MDSFAFIIHPIDPKRDVSRKFPLLGRVLTERQIDFFSTFFPPVYISEIEGITSAATGKEIKGWLIACPYTPQRMMELPVRRFIARSSRPAIWQKSWVRRSWAWVRLHRLWGCRCDHREALDVPVTTGDAYTVSIAVQAVACGCRGDGHIRSPNATAAVVGATGAIGRVCAELLAGEVGTLAADRPG